MCKPVKRYVGIHKKSTNMDHGWAKALGILMQFSFLRTRRLDILAAKSPSLS